MHLFLDRIPSPIGTIVLVSDGESLSALEFEDHQDRLHEWLRRRYPDAKLAPGPAARDTATRITAYFAGDLAALDAIPVRTRGTPFQERVWAALRRIPPGTTTTYGRLAATIGAPTASRAVGLANGANPVSLIVPCHRVIGADGSLTGYGGGLPRKRWLLRHETGARAGCANAEKEIAAFVPSQ